MMRAPGQSGEPMSKPSNEHLQAAEDLLLQTGKLLQQARQALVRDCATDGKLDSRRLDEMQIPCFEFAWASAEQLAAEQSLATLAHTGGQSERHELEQQLSLVYIAEAVSIVRGRLELLFAALDIPAVALRSLSEDAGNRHLQKMLFSASAMDNIVRLMQQHFDLVGYVELDDEHAMISEQFRRFARDAVAPRAEEIHRRNLTVPEEILQPLREVGVFGLAIPQGFGGIAPDDGEDNVSMIAVTEALSEASLAAAGSLITRPEILARALLTGGTDAQKQHWLPRLAAGDPLCAIAITEPDFGSDVASLALKASPCDGGWLLDGSKTWCTFAGKAGVIMVVCRTNPDAPGRKGLSLLLVEKPSFDGENFDYQQADGGRLTGSAIATIGYRGMHSFDLAFDNFFVPASHLIGGEAGEGRGFYYTMAGMTGGRMQTSARACGVMRGALRAALDYSEERKVFGASLKAYPLTAAKLSRMAARYAASRNLSYFVGRLLEQGGGRMEASLVKLFSCRAAEYVTREALQIHGGMGYAEECAVSRYFVDARVLSIFEGAEETLALKVIARTLLEETLRQEAA